IFDDRVECNKSEFNATDDNYTASIKCDQYLSTKPIGATIFINTVICADIMTLLNKIGATRQTIQQSVEFDATLTSFAIAGFEHWYDRVEFTLFQLTANMGGFLSVLSVIYLVQFGSRRINS
ncbi:23887_t:CDS:2, partial [Racocetra persica]